MKKAALLLDSSSTYKGKGVEDIFMIPLKIILNDNGIKEYKELVDIEDNQVYAWVNEEKKLSTSQPSIGEAMLQIEELLETYETVYVLPISKGISGTYETMVSVAKEINPERIVVLDFGFLGHDLLETIGKEILRKANSGCDKADIIEYIREKNNKFYSTIIVNDISHLKRGGRISLLKSFVANLLKIKIILEFKEKLEVLDKKTNYEDAVKRCMDHIDSKLQFNKNQIEKIEIWNNNIDDFEKIDETQKIVKKWFAEKKIDISKADFNTNILFPGVITVHTGTNTIGIVVWIK